MIISERKDGWSPYWGNTVRGGRGFQRDQGSHRDDHRRQQLHGNTVTNDLGVFEMNNRALLLQHAKVNQWTNGVVESCLASLTKLQKPFKYIVTCVIMQVNTEQSWGGEKTWNVFFSEEWCRPPHRQLLLLGQQHRRWEEGRGRLLELKYLNIEIFPGSCTVRWENKTMYCIVSVFGLAI